MFRKILISCACSVAILANSGTMNPITPDEAVKMLQEGNERFASDKIIRPHTDIARLKEVAQGQHPFVTINSCSDSRVPPELLFDQGFGDLFIIRNAGNVSATDEIGTIEYGTEHLGTRLVVVLGHTKCGAVTAVAKGEHVGGSIPALVAPIAPAVKKIKSAHVGHETNVWLNEAIKENVYEQIANILRKSQIVRDMVMDGKVKIVAAMYDVDTGKVQFLGEHPQQLRVLVEVEKNKKPTQSNVSTQPQNTVLKTESKPVTNAQTKENEPKNMPIKAKAEAETSH